MEYTKDDFIAWRNNPITRGFLQEVITEMNLSISELAIHAGKDSGADRFICGKLDGLRWLADWQPDFSTEEKENKQDESGDIGTSATY